MPVLSSGCLFIFHVERRDHHSHKNIWPLSIQTTALYATKYYMLSKKLKKIYWEIVHGPDGNVFHKFNAVHIHRDHRNPTLPSKYATH